MSLSYDDDDAALAFTIVSINQHRRINFEFNPIDILSLVLRHQFYVSVDSLKSQANRYYKATL